jgi:hypothetical protein
MSCQRSVNSCRYASERLERAPSEHEFMYVLRSRMGNSERMASRSITVGGVRWG